MIHDIDRLEKEIKKIDLYLAKEKGRAEKVKEKLDEGRLIYKKIKIESDLLEKVNILFQKTSEFAREQATNQIETLVTKCLQYVFDENIRFEIELEELRGRPNAKFYVVSEYDGKEIRLEPENSRGGGVVDVVSLALRIAFLEIHKPKIYGPLILDEPAKHVSNEYIYNVSNFLKQNSELFGRQIIMITHDNYLSAIGSKSYSVELLNGISNVTPTDKLKHLDNKVNE